MSLTKFFDVITKIVPVPQPLGRRADAISKLDPDKMYVENVRSALGVSTSLARLVCETAVRQGAFERHVEAVGPDGSVAASARREGDLPGRVRLLTEHEGRFEEADLETASLPKTTFYRLRK